MVIPNVCLFVFCVFAPFSRRKFIHRLRPVFFQLCYGRLHKSSPGIVRLHRALGAGWGGVGETGWKWDIRVKIDCHMKPYADKLFVVLYFSVRSSRSSAHGRHLQIYHGGGSWVFIARGGWGRREKWRLAGERSNRLSWQTNWELGKFFK